MRNGTARILAALLWLKEQYAFVTSQKFGRVVLLSLFIFVGIFHTSHPALAIGMPDSNDIAGLIASIAGFFASLLAGLIVTIIEYLIPVMMYNNFSNAPVVIAGWALVRDTVNMFFVILLIIIAFGTIFGTERFKHIQVVPRLLIFAIVINFSKTLCGLMIDFGQIIMLTFANALREIAAGNIIELFGLNKFSAFSGSQDPATNGIGAWDLALASLASVGILSWVLVIMLFEFVILLYRIVMLWILIVVAPLAWFVGGTDKMLKSEAYSDWWTKFKCLVSIGPIMTFFLWLALAVAGAGASAKGFDSSGIDDGNPAKFLTKIFEFQHFMSLVIGSAMLVAGLDVADSFCKGMPGIGGLVKGAKAWGPDNFKKLGSYAKKGATGAKDALLGTAAKYGAKSLRAVGDTLKGGAGVVGRSAASRVEGWKGDNVFSKGAKLFTKRGRADAKDKIAKGLGSGVLGRTFAPGLEASAEKDRQARVEEIAKFGKRQDGRSISSKVNQMGRFADSGATFKSGDYEAQSLMLEAMGNKDMEEEWRKSGKMGAMWSKFGGDMEENFKGDKDAQKKIAAWKKKYAQFSGDTASIRTSDDVKNLDNNALLDEKVRTDFESKTMVIKGKKGKNGHPDQPDREINFAQAMSEGRFGSEKQKIWAQGASGFSDGDVKQVDRQQIARGAFSHVAEREVAQSVKDGDMARVEALLAGLLASYKSAKTGEARTQLSQSMDTIVSGLRSNIANKNVSDALGRSSSRILRNFEGDRSRTKFAVENKIEETPVVLPALADHPDPVKHIQDTFKGASPKRIAEAETQVSAQRATMETEKTTKEQKIVSNNGETASKTSALEASIDKLTKELKSAYSSTEKNRLNGEISTAQTQRLAVIDKNDAANKELTTAIEKLDIDIKTKLVPAQEALAKLKTPK